MTNGYGREIYENGAYYYGYFKNELKHGQGKMVCEDG